jgi:hypothetical protein
VAECYDIRKSLSTHYRIMIQLTFVKTIDEGHSNMLESKVETYISTPDYKLYHRYPAAFHGVLQQLCTYLDIYGTGCPLIITFDPRVGVVYSKHGIDLLLIPSKCVPM